MASEIKKRLYPRKTLAIPVLSAWIFSNLYGLLFYPYLKFNFDCRNVIPKLTRIATKFPQEKFCEANSLLWSGLLYVFIIFISTVIIVRVINYKHRIFLDKKYLDRLKVRDIFFNIIMLIPFYIYYYSDLKFLSGQKIYEYTDIIKYCSREIRNLHFCSAIFIISFLVSNFSPQYSKIELK